MTDLAWFPEAIHKNIRPGKNDPAIEVVGAILHVAVSEQDSLEDFFRYRSGGIESHFYIRRDGTIEQYRDTGCEADANWKANSFYQDGRLKGYVSIETQGMGPGEWTKAQLDSILMLLRWLSREHGFPLVKATSPFGGGVGYHILFPNVWTPVAKSCPGPDRIKQFDNIIVPALKAGNGGSILSWNEELDAWHPGDKDHDDTMTAGQQLNQARGFAKAAFKEARNANNKAGRMERALKALASGMSDEVRKAVEAALTAEVTADVDIHITPREG